MLIRILLYKSDYIVTEDADKQEEERHITKALSDCGYPKWAVNKVEHDRTIQTKQDLQN